MNLYDNVKLRKRTKNVKQQQQQQMVQSSTKQSPGIGKPLPSARLPVKPKANPYLTIYGRLLQDFAPALANRPEADAVPDAGQSPPPPATAATTVKATVQQATGVKTALEMQAEFEKTMEVLFSTHQTDSVYSKCLKITGMTHHIAMNIFRVKQFLRKFVSQIPEHLRPELEEYNNSEKIEEYFTVLLDRALKKGNSPMRVEKKVNKALKSATDFVREIPECLIGLNYIVHLMPRVFDDDEKEGEKDDEFEEEKGEEENDDDEEAQTKMEDDYVPSEHGVSIWDLPEEIRHLQTARRSKPFGQPKIRVHIFQKAKTKCTPMRNNSMCTPINSSNSKQQQMQGPSTSQYSPSSPQYSPTSPLGDSPQYSPSSPQYSPTSPQYSQSIIPLSPSPSAFSIDAEEEEADAEGGRDADEEESEDDTEETEGERYARTWRCGHTPESNCRRRGPRTPASPSPETDED